MRIFCLILSATVLSGRQGFAQPYRDPDSYTRPDTSSKACKTSIAEYKKGIKIASQDWDRIDNATRCMLGFSKKKCDQNCGEEACVFDAGPILSQKITRYVGMTETDICKQALISLLSGPPPLHKKSASKSCRDAYKTFSGMIVSLGSETISGRQQYDQVCLFCYARDQCAEKCGSVECPSDVGPFLNQISRFQCSSYQENVICKQVMIGLRK